MQRRVPAQSIALVAPVLLMVVAVASRPVGTASGTGPTAPVWIWIASDTVLQALLMVLLVASLVATAINIWAVWPPPKGKPRPRPLRASLLSYLYFALAIVVLLVRARLRPASGAPPAPLALPGLGQFVSPPVPQGITWLSALMALAIIGAGVILFLRWWRSLAEAPLDMGAARQLERPQERIAKAIEDSLDALRAEPDPRRAVIAAYARLEAELKAAGHARQPSETPLELMARILGELPVGLEPLQRLTDLFEWAKFSHHPVDQEMKGEAIDALMQLREQLQHPTPALGGRSE